MKILVTGGNGFIGSHLCEALINSGHKVTIVDLKKNKNTDNINCPKFITDICEKEMITQLVQDKDLIIHLAAVSRVDDAQINPIRCYNTNVTGTLNILEAIRNSNTKIIFSSSREVYGESKEMPVRETAKKKPITIYGSSKLAGEELLNIYRKIYDLNFIILRFANVFGSPHDIPQRVIPRFINLSLKEEPLIINGGNQVIDFTFIDDVVEGITEVVKRISSNGKEFFGEDYNLSSGKGTSVKDLSKIIKKIFNSNSELIFNEERKYDVQNFIGDYTKAKLAFSFEPKYSLSEGLEKYKKRL